MNIFKILLNASAIAILTFCLSGCYYTSNVVSSIGAREIYGTAQLDSSNNITAIEMADAARNPSMGHGGFSLPYFLERSKNFRPINDVKIEYVDIKWARSGGNRKYGEVETIISGEPYIISVKEIASEETGSKSLSFEYRYRRWYSYPLQSLMLVTFPFDCAVTVATTGILVTVAPIIWGVMALIESPEPKPTIPKREKNEPSNCVP